MDLSFLPYLLLLVWERTTISSISYFDQTLQTQGPLTLSRNASCQWEIYYLKTHIVDRGNESFTVETSPN